MLGSRPALGASTEAGGGGGGAHRLLRRGGGQEERGWPPGTAALPWVRPLEEAVGGLVVVTGHGKAPVKRGGGGG